MNKFKGCKKNCPNYIKLELFKPFFPFSGNGAGKVESWIWITLIQGVK